MKNFPAWIIFGLLVGILVAVCGIGGLGFGLYTLSRRDDRAATLPKQAPDTETNPRKNDQQSATPRLPVRNLPNNGEAQDAKRKWRSEVEAEWALAKTKYNQAESISSKPKLMTEQEYQQARQQAQSWLTNTYEPLVFPPWFSKDGGIAEIVLPRHFAVYRREGYQQILAMNTDSHSLDVTITLRPELRLLKDPKFQQLLRARLPFKERKERFVELAALTQDKSTWSLLHPFDDLAGTEMIEVLEIAKKISQNGLASINKEQRLLILRAGALAYFKRMLDAAN